MTEQPPGPADFGSPPEDAGRVAPLSLMALVLALASLLVPGGLIALPALYMAANAERKRGGSSLVTAARVVSVVSLAGWAVVLAVVAVVKFA
ncbi:MAG: hypothetical protein ACRD0Q_01505 [Acidimicrobiales bacterium]